MTQSWKFRITIFHPISYLEGDGSKILSKVVVYKVLYFWILNKKTQENFIFERDLDFSPF